MMPGILMKPFSVSALIALTLVFNLVDGYGQEIEISLAEYKKAHQTKLLRKQKIGVPAPEPPAGVFERVAYDTSLGKMAAYISPDPKDGKKHPIIIWRVGGFANSISDDMWEDADPENDQSASQYRKAGVLMMHPSLRGGNENPGFIEGCYGEVEDVLAAAEYAKKLPYVDPEQIYLGGHSVGGTLALLTAAMDKHPFKAIISFGPIHSTAQYGEENVPFDVESEPEMLGRAPIVFLDKITTDTWVIEGANDGNLEALKHMQENCKNPKVRFIEVPGDHFSILAPLNEFIAKRIVAASQDGKFTLDAVELKKAAKK